MTWKHNLSHKPQTRQAILSRIISSLEMGKIPKDAMPAQLSQEEKTQIRQAWQVGKDYLTQRTNTLSPPKKM